LKSTLLVVGLDYGMKWREHLPFLFDLLTHLLIRARTLSCPRSKPSRGRWRALCYLSVVIWLLCKYVCSRSQCRELDAELLSFTIKSARYPSEAHSINWARVRWELVNAFSFFICIRPALDSLLMARANGRGIVHLNSRKAICGSRQN